MDKINSVLFGPNSIEPQSGRERDLLDAQKAREGKADQETISRLKEIPKIKLNQIREENDVEFFLEIVPSIYVDDINPCLAPPLDVIDFCHATRTQIDIDMYLFNSENE